MCHSGFCHCCKVIASHNQVPIREQRKLGKSGCLQGQWPRPPVSPYIGCASWPSPCPLPSCSSYRQLYISHRLVTPHTPPLVGPISQVLLWLSPVAFLNCQHFCHGFISVHSSGRSCGIRHREDPSKKMMFGNSPHTGPELPCICFISHLKSRPWSKSCASLLQCFPSTSTWHLILSQPSGHPPHCTNHLLSYLQLQPLRAH